MKAQVAQYTKKLAEYTQKKSKVFKKNGRIERDFYEEELYKLQHDYESHKAYDKYEKYRDKMFRLSGTILVPWIELQADDKKRARLNAVRYMLSNIAYTDRDMDVIKGVDKKILKLHS